VDLSDGREELSRAFAKRPTVLIRQHQVSNATGQVSRLAQRDPEHLNRAD